MIVLQGMNGITLHRERIVNNMEITKEQFMAYEDVRVSGVTNMWAVDLVMELSGLTEGQCLFIMKNYGSLAKKYL